jgi:hypothetical protein
LYLSSNIFSYGHQADEEPETPCTNTTVGLCGCQSFVR